MASERDGRATELVGRANECETLDRLLMDALAGASRALVLRGEAGMGKIALLTYMTDKASGWRTARAVRVASEMELASPATGRRRHGRQCFLSR